MQLGNADDAVALLTHLLVCTLRFILVPFICGESSLKGRSMPAFAHMGHASLAALQASGNRPRHPAVSLSSTSKASQAARTDRIGLKVERNQGACTRAWGHACIRRVESWRITLSKHAT